MTSLSRPTSFPSSLHPSYTALSASSTLPTSPTLPRLLLHHYFDLCDLFPFHQRHLHHLRSFTATRSRIFSTSTISFSACAHSFCGNTAGRRLSRPRCRCRRRHPTWAMKSKKKKERETKKRQLQERQETQADKAATEPRKLNAGPQKTAAEKLEQKCCGKDT